MSHPPAFTVKRLQKYLVDHRNETGTLATLKDLESSGFDKELVDKLVRSKNIQELYVTLTSGAIVKGYKTVS